MDINERTRLYDRLIEVLDEKNVPIQPHSGYGARLKESISHLALDIAENIVGVPCGIYDIKFKTKQEMEQANVNGFAALVPADNNAVYICIDNINDMISQTKAKRGTYNQTAMAALLIDLLTHELTHRRQALSQSFNRSNWLNEMYKANLQVSRDPGYIDTYIEAEAYRGGYEGERKFLQSIGREQDFSIDDGFLKNNHLFNMYACTYGEIPFHPEPNGTIVNIADFTQNTFQQLTPQQRQYLLKQHPILGIQYDENGNPKTVEELAKQYIERKITIGGKEKTLTDDDLRQLDFIYCFVFANRLNDTNCKNLYKLYGKSKVDQLFSNINHMGTQYRNYYKSCYDTCRRIKNTPDFEIVPGLESTYSSMDAKFNSCDQYMQNIMSNLNRYIAGPDFSDPGDGR